MTRSGVPGAKKLLTLLMRSPALVPVSPFAQVAVIPGTRPDSMSAIVGGGKTESASTTTAVAESRGDGHDWAPASAGEPRAPECTTGWSDACAFYRPLFVVISTAPNTAAEP